MKWSPFEITDDRTLRGNGGSEQAEAVTGVAMTVLFDLPRLRSGGLATRSRVAAQGGGWGEIRTHGDVAATPVFKTGALNRSATHPCLTAISGARLRRNALGLPDATYFSAGRLFQSHDRPA
jgi:hypothetical protein